MFNHSTIILLTLLVPLTLDTFVLSSALGLAGLPKHKRITTSLTFALFEGLMPAVGVLLGHGVDHIIGRFAGYIAAAVIAIAGVILLKPAKEEEKELRKLKLLNSTKGLAIIYLGISISIDEVAIGFSLGLLGISILLAAILIACQAFLASQLGLWLGDRLSDKLRDKAEKAAGLVLVATGVILAIAKVLGSNL
jgi:putative Mn2+ efflux pump MntP